MHWRKALSTYARQHESHCTEFARSVLEQVAREDPIDYRDWLS